MLVTSPRMEDLETNSNHPKGPVKVLGAPLEHQGLDMPELADEGLTRLAWVNFMGITEDLTIMEVLEDMAYITVRKGRYLAFAFFRQLKSL